MSTHVIALEGVTRRFGDVTAVDDLSLALEPGEFVTLLGPSGCGKTTALRLLAGFEHADGGTIRFRGDDITAWSPQRRGFGMVFQNYALFPHLDVFENVAFGLRSRKHPASDIPARVDAALARVDLAGYARRAVQALSGGQQQRVALARALAIEPPLLLLDEPLSNLDQALRVRTRTELRTLVRDLGITALFVTHDQEEAFDLSDRIAVMSAGRLRQFDAPRELYERPADRFVAGFVGRVNEFPVVVEGDAVVLPGGVRWQRPAGGGEGASPPGRGDALLLLRPENLVIVPLEGAAGFQADAAATATAGAPIDAGAPADARALSDAGTPADAGAQPRARLPGMVTDRRFAGPVTTWRVKVEGVESPLEVSAASDRTRDGFHPAPGDEVGVTVRRPGLGMLFGAGNVAE